MHYVGVQAGETTVRLVGHSNPLRLSLSAFLYLYSKCQCINGFQGVLPRRGGERGMRKAAEKQSSHDRVFVCLGRAV